MKQHGIYTQRDGFQGFVLAKCRALARTFQKITEVTSQFFFPQTKNGALLLVCVIDSAKLISYVIYHCCYEYKVQRMYIITVFIWKAIYVTVHFDRVNINGDTCTSTLFTLRWQRSPSMWMWTANMQKNCSEMARGHDKELETSAWSPNSSSQSDRAFVGCLGQVRSTEAVQSKMT